MKIHANILLIKDEGDKIFIKKLKQFCKERMDKFKIPIKVKTVHEHQYISRYKKIEFFNLFLLI